LAANLKARFTDTMVSTASSERLLTMCYDRILRDLREARHAIEQRQTMVAHTALVHAQDIIGELERAVDVNVWPAGRDLLRLYGFLRSRMMEANLRKSVGPIDDCLLIVDPLASAWHEAYRIVDRTAGR
jgi:flagellar protein FliS